MDSDVVLRPGQLGQGANDVYLFSTFIAYFNNVYFYYTYFKTIPIVYVTVGDSGLGADASGPSLPVSDVGSGVESKQYGPSLLDAGIGDDSKVIPGPYVLDAGYEVRPSPFDPGYFATVYFTTGILAFAIELLVPEAGSGSEAPTIGQAESDTGQGVDAQTEGPSVPDSGIGLEVHTIAASFTIGDLGIGLDAVSKGFWVFDLGAGDERFAIRVLRSGRLQYTVRLRVTEDAFDPSAYDPYAYE